MINFLHGTIRETKEQGIVLDIGPMGFDIQVANSAVFKTGDTVDLFTHLHWNQEHGPSIFGFQSEIDKQVFQLIISCSGMGPKVALAVLHQLGAATFIQTIQTGNEEILSKVSGIGPKKAEQMIVHLRQKVKKMLSGGITIDSTSIQAGQQLNDVINALESLNYSRPEINKAMKYLSEECAYTTLPFEQLVRKALSLLSKRI